MAQPRMKKMIQVLIVLLALLALAWVLLRMLPPGFDTDLTQIGGGERAVVLVHDHNFVESVELMEALDGVRQRQPEAMLYLVADLNTPRGQRFADNHDVDAVTLVLFDARGRTVAVRSGRLSREQIEDWLNEHLPPY